MGVIAFIIFLFVLIIVVPKIGYGTGKGIAKEINVKTSNRDLDEIYKIHDECAKRAGCTGLRYHNGKQYRGISVNDPPDVQKAFAKYVAEYNLPL